MYGPFEKVVYVAGLVDLDATFLVQVVVFLIFLVLLNVLVVKPLLKAQEQRHARMQGARKDAEDMELRAAEAHSEYENRRDTARKDAVQIRDQLKASAEADRATLLERVADENAEAAAKAKAALDAKVAEVEAGMEAQAEALAELIAGRVLKTGGLR